MTMRVAALIPAYQAAARLGEVLAGLRALDPAPDVLVVDDGSRDATAEVARGSGARVISFPENRGKGHALLAGFQALAEYEGIVTLDADGQHPPEYLPAFVRAAEAGADLVLARRLRTPDMPIPRRLANALSSGWASWLAGQRISDSQCGYRLYGRALLERTPARPGRYELETEIVVRAAWLGFRLAEFEIPTIYDAQSQLRVFRDVPRIVAVLGRLTAERLWPAPARHPDTRTP